MSEALDQVASVFITNAQRDPHLNSEGDIDITISLQLRGYRNEHPPEQQQRALTPYFIRQLYNRANNKLGKDYLQAYNLRILLCLYIV